jgi:D-glycero-D-manno-heptose 1,7-bisphosphate phosphatase
MKRAVFLDRDGTLIEESGYLDRLDRLVFFPYSVDAVRLLNRAGFVVVVVTNQAGIARGIVRERFVAEAHRAISERLGAGGARVDAYYYCPHHRTGEVTEYVKECDCRKPRPGMFLRAADELGLDLTRSFVVGDRWHDVAAARAVGSRGILVRSGLGRGEEAAPQPGLRADIVVDTLIDATAWILDQP